jgi:5-methyltetrahydropteroyltriglutamate--homocysteine methyltransferase
MKRILTTHCGSLPRPHDLLDLMKAKVNGQPYDEVAYAKRVRDAVGEIVRRQAEVGIDVVTDGEQSKPGFFTYVKERLAGFEARPDMKYPFFPAEVNAFPEYYKDYFARAMLGGAIARPVPMVCTGPVRYTGEESLKKDIENLKAALKGLKPAAVFMPAVAPSGVGRNEYYKTEPEYFHAVADAMHHEYKAIVDAGFQVQIDDPFLSEIFSDPELDRKGQHQRAAMYAEAVNHGLRGIPAEKVRFHTCYGINEGPRVHDASLKEVAPRLLKINAGAYSFEAANARHEHEYHLWESIRLPKGKKLIPGVITHASNIVEHPELIAERIVRFARLVGRDNVIAGTDCGFSSQATYKTEVHPTVMWAKFAAMVKGAKLASRQLWK